MERLDLVFWYPGINPYIADRFSALAKTGRVNFECWFTRGIDPNRSWRIDEASLDFPHRPVRNVTAAGQAIGIPVGDLLRARPRVLVSFYADPSVAGSFLQHLIPDAKLVYYVEKTFDTWFQRTRAKEAAKHALLRLADGFMTPGEDADGYVRKYANPSSPILRLNHVVQVDHFAKARVLRDSDDTKARKKLLGLSGFVFLYVGRIWSQKGIDSLLTATTRLRSQGLNISLLLVGDGPERSHYIDQAQRLGLDNVVFLDFVQQDLLPDVYALADSFVFPTRGDPYGLVVDEAMASGLPVVATDAAGEICTRVFEGRTGFLVPPDNPEMQASAMGALVNHPDRAREMGANAFGSVRHRTPEYWARQVENNLGLLLAGVS